MCEVFICCQKMVSTYCSGSEKMDKSKMSETTKVDLCRKFVILSLYTVFYFFACLDLQDNEKIIEKMRSISSLTVLFFQTYRRQGLVWADYLTFIFPVGRV
ncbi:hypothetical protein ANCDUO_05478 [Ancylostoma duodenale]|uniref:Uncharacterized protein n=1 Tax=Ancylostoma duodenale TaxID=51022 RepID=A0A0C2DNE5_9BILA|nr:hypothetical protein ANCDUO_05478 [Ancylostoma duodenale]